MSIFKLPDLGEGLPEAEVVNWYIKEGDIVNAEQLLVAVETAKAIVDIPSPQAGKIIKLFGNKGDLIHTGDPLLEFLDKTSTTMTPNTKKPHESTSVVGEIPTSNEVINELQQSTTHHKTSGTKATPAVRALAHRLNIDLSIVTPSGLNETIKASDVERVAKILKQVGQLTPIKGVRRAMAIAMSKAHAEVVPVTLNDDADIESWDAHEDATLRLIRALIIACQKEPSLNAWYDSHSIGRRLIKAIHLGIAVDSNIGLFVPVIRDAETYSPPALRRKIDDLKHALHERSVPPDELRGYTITLSNFGNIGGRYANPIVIPPAVAILGAGRIQKTPVVVGQGFEAHNILPLSLSFDHRAVTGGEACRFLMAVIHDLQKAT